MRTFGLIGYPLSHSFSKKYFTAKFDEEGISDCAYELFPIASADEIVGLIAGHPTLCGLNVTIPHKLNVIPYLDSIDDAAKAIGAVNCIAIDQSGSAPMLRGYNTDAYGFAESLRPLLREHHQKALVFGDGGAAKAVKYTLDQFGIPYLIVSRQSGAETIPYSAVTSAVLHEYQVLINTTPLGMAPEVHTAPEIPYDQLTSENMAYDLVYNPEETLFLRKAREKGAAVKNGLEMLYLQAERSWQIWNP